VTYAWLDEALLARYFRHLPRVGNCDRRAASADETSLIVLRPTASMPEPKSRWSRDLFAIPLAVAVVAAVFTYGFPKFLEKGRELSYSIDGPTSSLSTQSAGGLAISVNGVSTTQLFGYKVRLWNSGGLPLKDVPVRLVFRNPPPDFRIFSITHTTIPRFEFGAIQDLTTDSTSRRFAYQLLNQGNEDQVSLVTNRDPVLEVYANVEGMALKKAEIQPPRRGFEYLNVVVAVVAGLASLLSGALKFALQRRDRS
jgi:hypothetical protein